MEPGLSQMNEKFSSGDRISSDGFWLRANWRAVHAFNRVNSKRNEQRKMKTLIRSINRSPLRCSFFTLAIALCCFALSPPLKAQCPVACGQFGNTAVGVNALYSVIPPGGFNNTAVGFNALTADTTGQYNVAIGSGALQSNTTGNLTWPLGRRPSEITATSTWALVFERLHEHRRPIQRRWRCGAQEQHDRRVLIPLLVRCDQGKHNHGAQRRCR